MAIGPDSDPKFVPDRPVGFDPPAVSEASEPDLHETLLASASSETLEIALHSDDASTDAESAYDAASGTSPAEVDEPVTGTFDSVTDEPEAPAGVPEFEASELSSTASAEGSDTPAPDADPVPDVAAPMIVEAVAGFVPDEAASVPPGPAPGMASAIVLSTAFTPTWIDFEGIGAVLISYVRNESAAAFSHMRTLSTVRSPADMIRVQVSEMQRAADASLTCWSRLARHAARSLPRH